MLTATLRGILAHKVRLLMSGLAVVLGVAFVAGSYVFTDTLDRAFTSLTTGAFGDVVVSQASLGQNGGGGGFGVRGASIPADVVAEVAAVPGAARADGRITTIGTFVVDRDNKLVSSGSGPGLAVSYSSGPAAHGLAPATLVSGHWPTKDGEIVLDTRTAAKAGYTPGDTVPIVSSSAQPRIEPTLVGTADFAGTSLLGASVVMFSPSQAQQLFMEGKDAYSTIWVTAAPGTSQDQLAAEVAKVLPPDLKADTGDALAARTSSRISDALSFVTVFLLVFAGIALTVGAFLIVNTFSILVAQRSRELALLRAIGASRRQVTRSVLLEAGVVGLVGSAVGVGLGVLLAVGIRAAFGAAGLDLSATELVLRPRTVVVALTVGVVVTMVAAYLPARRAGRVPPVAAMRDDVASSEGGMRRRTYVGVGLVVLGAVGMTGGLLGWGSEPTYVLGVGVLGVLIGVALASPLLGRPILAAVGWVYRRSFGAVGLMAEQNTARSPRRTGATASALMLGVSLVVTMAVLGDSAKASIDKALAQDIVADYVFSNVTGPGGFSATIADEAAQVPGVADVVRVRAATISLGTDREFAFAVDPQRLAGVITPVVTAGSLTDLGSDGVALSSTYAADHSLGVGSQTTLGFAGQQTQATVVAIYTTDAVLSSDVTMSLDGFDTLGVPPTDRTVFVVTAPGADRTVVSKDLEALVADLPTVTVGDQAEYAAQQREPIDRMLFIVYALLGLAVVIAILGIVNTLALSVLERIREIGLLRAVGLSRRQLRTMLRLEAVAIALLGAVLGIVLGLVFGLALQRSLVDRGIDVLAIPWLQLAAFTAISVLVGVLAALWPGRRAARLDILKAIATE